MCVGGTWDSQGQCGFLGSQRRGMEAGPPQRVPCKCAVQGLVPSTKEEKGGAENQGKGLCDILRKVMRRGRKAGGVLRGKQETTGS